MDGPIVLWSIAIAGTLAVLLTLWKRVYLPLRPGYIVAEILDATGDVKRYNKRVRNDEFTHEGHTYEVIANTDKAMFVYRTGMFRRPTSFYVVGCSIPKDWRENLPEISEITSSWVRNEQKENRIAKELADAFKRTGIDATQSLMLIIIVVIGGIGYLWYTQNQNFEKLTELIQKTGGG
jgi:hypothetical protein